MDGAIPPMNAMGLKCYSAMKDGTSQFVVVLFSSNTGRLDGILEADWLGRIRTGAASAVAAKYLARPESLTLGLVGAGKQAETQLEGLLKVRPLKEVMVYARRSSSLILFCEKMSEKFGIPVSPASTLEEAVRDKDLIVTATNSKDPFLLADWIKPGCHITAIGANHILRRELYEAVYKKADIVVVDSIEQAKIESGEIHAAVAAGMIEWSQLVELRALVTGAYPGRQTPHQITLFKSHGIALWDIAVARKVIDLVREVKTPKTFSLDLENQGLQR
jgi:ornithine cyclodeaminase